MARISTHEGLRALYKAPVERVKQKQLDYLDPHCRSYIALSPFVLVATQGADGLIDVSPRGDRPGMVHVLDDHTLAIPDRPGNNRLDTLSNIIDTGSVGLVFLIPGRSEALRVNGTAVLDDDGELCAQFAVRDKPAKMAIVVSVKEAYLHCGKAVIRSRLWDPDAQVGPDALPTISAMIRDQVGGTEVAEGNDELLARYEKQLY